MPKGSVFIETVLRLCDASIRDRLISFDCLRLCPFGLFLGLSIMGNYISISLIFVFLYKKKKIQHEIVSRHLNK